MLDLPAEHIRTLLAILAQHVPHAEVRAFGSRVAGGAAPWSDLDLVVEAEQRLELGTLGALEEALQRSDLPFRVDVVDWHRVTETFREAIAGDEVLLRGPG